MSPLRERVRRHPEVKFSADAAKEATLLAMSMVHTLFLRSVSREVNRLEAAEAERRRPRHFLKQQVLSEAAENVWKEMSTAKRDRKRMERRRSREEIGRPDQMIDEADDDEDDVDYGKKAKKKRGSMRRKRSKKGSSKNSSEK